METKNKLELFTYLRKIDMLLDTTIFRTMLIPYSKDDLKELTDDKRNETYNHYADTYLDLIMKRCIESDGFKIFLNLSKDKTIIEKNYGNISGVKPTHSTIKIFSGGEYDMFNENDKSFIEYMLGTSDLTQIDYNKLLGSFIYETSEVWIESSANSFSATVYLMKSNNSDLIIVYTRYENELGLTTLIPIGSIVKDFHEGKYVFLPIYMNDDSYTLSFDHNRDIDTIDTTMIKNVNPIHLSLLNLMDTLVARNSCTTLYKSENESFVNNDGLLHLNALDYFIDHEFKNDYIRMDENSQYVKFGIECKVSRKLWNNETKTNYIMLSARLIDLLKEIGELRAC